VGSCPRNVVPLFTSDPQISRIFRRRMTSLLNSLMDKEQKERIIRIAIQEVVEAEKLLL